MALAEARLFGQPQPCVVVAGGGVAASALACLLVDRGFGVLLLTKPARAAPPPVIEAFPEATVRLFDQVGLGEALARSGAVAVRGFDNAMTSGTYGMDGWWAHVERGGLARACLLEARRRGAGTLPVSQIGRQIETVAGGGVRVRADGRSLEAFAAVDATGRTARWSRPVHRAHAAVTALFSGPGAGDATRGRFAATPTGWAYCVRHPDATTVGVTSRLRSTPGRLADVASRLGLVDHTAYVPLGPRSAAVQWAEQPIGDGRVAIGDAALAYSPLAGQGVRFALSSALAATTVLATWRDGDAGLAAEYYRTWVDEARRRHLAAAERAIDGDDAPAPDPVGPSLDPEMEVRFAAIVRPAPLNVDGQIRLGDAVVLPDGGLVRWAGGFDILQLRRAVELARTVGGTCAELARIGMADEAATLLVAWALQKGLLAAGRETHGAAADAARGTLGG